MAPVAPFRLKLLGGFEARRVDGSAIGISAKKSRALLAYLALTGGRTHQRGKLADLLWSDRGDKQARDSLRQALAELRDALADVHPAALTTDHDLVSLAPAAVDVDALRFAELAGRDSAEELRCAAALYDGDLLDSVDVHDATFEDWLSRERQRYRELMVATLKKLLPHETGAVARAVAQRMLTLDPLEEAGHRALMCLYAAAGDFAAALRQYDTCRATLKRELDITPSPETEAQHQQIRDQSIARPGSARAAVAAADMPQPATSSPSKPSVAVLPFRNLSGDPGQQYFSDGITEDIITELSRFRLLTVIGRDSSFQYRDKSVHVTDIGRDLGVEYVVEGSVRMAGKRIRVTAQLIEAGSGNHLWAEHYDRDMEDIFAVQDAVTQSIVATLPGRIAEAGARLARRKRPASLAAYDYLLRGVECQLSYHEAHTQSARDMYEKAIALDPEFAPAYAHLAAIETRGWWVGRSPESLERGYKLARRAVALDENDGLCQEVFGYICLERRQFDLAAFHIERAIALNPNDPAAVIVLGSLLAYTGRPDEGLSWIGKAFRLNPYAPQWYHSAHGMVLYAARRYADTIAAFGRITSGLDAWEYIYAVASYGQLGRIEEAQAQIAACRALHPDMSLLQHAAHEPYKEPADLDHLLEGLRKAGLTA
jgi:TolB-like protein/Tfp pilus assembly protein PilF